MNLVDNKYKKPVYSDEYHIKKRLEYSRRMHPRKKATGVADAGAAPDTQGILKRLEIMDAGISELRRKLRAIKKSIEGIEYETSRNKNIID